MYSQLLTLGLGGYFAPPIYIVHFYYLIIINRSPTFFVAVSQYVMAIITLKELPMIIQVHYDNYQYVHR